MVLLPLWIYLAGLPVALAVAGWTLGQNYERIKKEARDVGGALFGWGFLGFVMAGLWPVAFLFTAALLRGHKVHLNTVKLRRQLAAANAELDKVKADEGWR